MNVADPASIKQAVDRAAAELGGLDILVNNAGIIRYGTVEDVTVEDIDAILSVNVRGMIQATQAALPHMSEGGRIISTGSNLAERVPDAGKALYSASKAALIAWTKGTARDLGPRGITVNLVHPGSTNTDMNPADGPQAEAQRQRMAIKEYGRVGTSPRFILTATLVLYAAGNALVATTSEFGIMLLARVIQGAVLPGFISVGASVVTRFALPAAHGRGLARANIGFVLGVLLALPAGVALAQGGNWRMPFMVLAVASLALAPIIAPLFPRVPKAGAVGLGGQLRLLRRPLFLAHLALSVALFSSMFSAYTYLGAWIEQTFGLTPSGVAFALFLFGMAGLLGNGVAGRYADRAVLRSTAVAILVLVAAVNLAALAGASMLMAAVPMFLWSVSHTASVTLGQVRVTLAGRDAPPFAMTMNISAANLGIAIGTLGGGGVIDRYHVGAIGLAPIGFALVALRLLILIGRSVARRSETDSDMHASKRHERDRHAA
nr:SDR family NAD(P)-dependent oxidoreductase [Bordetella genomosp. 9]